jgi:hypothetical protein
MVKHYKKYKINPSDPKEWDRPQRDMFFEIRLERGKKCEVTGKELVEPLSYYFAHVLPKWLYPNYKYDSYNIIMVSTMQLHGVIDDLRAWKFGEIEEELLAGNRITFNYLKQLNKPKWLTI